MKELSKVLNVQDIKGLLPHRYPFLMVDRVLEVIPKERAVAIKNVTCNENYFQGHYPGSPIMPGVLLVESMAQVAGIAMLSAEEFKGKIPYFVGIDNIRFRKPVVPGDTIKIVVEISKIKGKIGRAKGEVYVEAELMAEGELMFAAVDSQAQNS